MTMMLATVMWLHQARWHAVPPPPPPVVAPPPPAHAPDDYRAVAADHVVPRGWVYREFQCLDTLWQRESGWNPHARNPSGAAGIPQLVDPPHAERLPAGEQIELGAVYIARRYGHPCVALAHSYRQGWY